MIEAWETDPTSDFPLNSLHMGCSYPIGINYYQEFPGRRGQEQEPWMVTENGQGKTMVYPSWL